MPIKELEATPELFNDPSLKDIPDVVTLAKSFRDTKAFVGNAIRPPGPNASEADKKDFYDKLVKHAPHLVPLDDKDETAQKLVWNKLGRPDKPEEYVAEIPKELEGRIDIESLRAVAVETGMTKAQFQKAVGKAVTHAQKTKVDAETDSFALKKEWGAAYDTKLSQAADAAAKQGAPEAFVKLVASGALPSGQLKIWANIAKSIGAEANPVGKQNGAGGAVLTPAEAELQIAEIQANPLFLDRNGGMLRQALLKRYEELHKFLNPE